jgi:hypothetical protein
MKKVLIIATAMFFAASVSVLATTQNQTGKIQPQKSTTAVKQEVQKPAVKAEAQKPAVKAETQKQAVKAEGQKPAVKAEVQKSPQVKVAPVAQVKEKEGVKQGPKMHKKHMEPKAKTEIVKPAAEPKK